MRRDTPDIRRAYTKRIFSTVAPVYRLVTHALSFGRDAAWKRALVRALPRIETGTILDLACGSGDIARACASRFPHCRVVGADLCAEMLSRFPNKDRRSVRLTLQDMHALAVRTSSVDICTGGYALRNAPDLHVAVTEVARVVKPGGVAAFLDFSRSPNRIFSFFATALLAFWGSLWGLVLHGNPRIYGYIAESLAKYPDRVALRRLFATKGFSETASWRRMFGMIEIILFKKDGAA
jgi:ubiquinone/menaquinone biosynthesis methyltransferase